jgi:hypothetical protein
LFQINKNNSSNGHSNFSRRWPHMFNMLFEKSSDIFLDFRSKLFGNILKIFLISCSKLFKLIFLESLAENIGNGYFHYIGICFRFVFSLLFILFNHTFWNETTVRQKFIKAVFYAEFRKIYHTLRVSLLLHFLQLLCHKNAPNQLFMLWTHRTTQMTTK